MDMQRLMAQAQQMQKQLSKIEEELDATEYTGNAGGDDAVSVRMNGKHEVQEVVISDDLMDKDSREMLQDMLLVAMNNALQTADEDRNAKMGSVTQGVKIPGM